MFDHDLKTQMNRLPSHGDIQLSNDFHTGMNPYESILGDSRRR